MMNRLRVSAVQVKRGLVALKDQMATVRDSYSQCGEDRIVSTLLQDVPLSGGIYVDVGANQPTQISNTYLFYRRGHDGVAIEPNVRLRALYRWTRPRDVFVSVGCGAEWALKSFHRSSASVTSSFAPVKDSIGKEVVPVIRLDAIRSILDYEFIFLLSVDTEGFDYQTLQGAHECLRQTLCVVVEQSGQSSRIDALLTDAGFSRVETTPVNDIYVHSDRVDTARS